MRSKPIICASGIFFLFLALLPVVRPRTEAPPADIGWPKGKPTADSVTPRTHPHITQTENGSASGDVPRTAIQGPETANKMDPQARSSELMDLAMNNDSASLQTILGELRNPDTSIRSAALQAVIQFGSRDAIPVLQQDAEQTQDVSEKAQILDAIEFLKLPSLSETMIHNTPTAEAKTSAQPPP